MASAALAGQRFSRAARLRLPTEFRLCFDEGRRVAGRWLMLVARRRADREPPRFGLAVGRKVGSAVARNRLRRQLRESFRRSGLRPALAGLDLVAVVRNGGSGLSGGEVSQELERLLRLLLRKLS